MAPSMVSSSEKGWSETPEGTEADKTVPVRLNSCHASSTAPTLAGLVDPTAMIMFVFTFLNLNQFSPDDIPIRGISHVIKRITS